MAMSGARSCAGCQDGCVGAQVDRDGRSQGGAEKAPRLQRGHIPRAQGAKPQCCLTRGRRSVGSSSLATVPRNGVGLPSWDSTPAKGTTF